jgi:hypothetical protein
MALSTRSRLCALRVLAALEAILEFNPEVNTEANLEVNPETKESSWPV